MCDILVAMKALFFRFFDGEEEINSSVGWRRTLSSPPGLAPCLHHRASIQWDILDLDVSGHARWPGARAASHPRCSLSIFHTHTHTYIYTHTQEDMRCSFDVSVCLFSDTRARPHILSLTHTVCVCECVCVHLCYAPSSEGEIVYCRMLYDALRINHEQTTQRDSFCRVENYHTYIHTHTHMHGTVRFREKYHSISSISSSHFRL